ncbi:hypothetical protein PG988_009460 [Apiospora saccharicola]
MALLVCGLLLSNSFAGLISAGILYGMAGVGHLAAWRWLFILEGLATAVVGVTGYFVIPDYPGTIKWLSEEEKVVAQGRLAADAGNEDGTGEDEVTIWQGIAWGLKDSRVWLFACLQMATVASISYSHFFPTLIQQIGFKNNTTKRSPHAIISGAVAMAATVCLIALGEQKWARYALTFFVCAGTFGIFSTTYTWLSSTIVQPRVKCAAAIGIANTCANPYFRESWACLLAFQALGMACIMTLRQSDAEAMGRLPEEEKRAVANGYRYII